MTKLLQIKTKKTVNPGGPVMEIQLDWDNDRHQYVTVKDLDPKSIYEALVNLSTLIYSDIESEEI